MVGAQTTKERLDLFNLFGRSAFLHENNHNAPAGGSFTFVAYADTGIMVDWILRPQMGAQRPEDSRLLFDRVGILVQPLPGPETIGKRAGEASEIIAFFWMMTAVTVKYIQRGDAVFVTVWLEELSKLVDEVERRIHDRGWEYHRGSYSELKVTARDQIAAIRWLCARMEALSPEVERMGGYVASSPMPTVELLINIAREKLGI